jgi:flagellar motor switch protein FliG/flagellar motor component MotA
MMTAVELSQKSRREGFLALNEEIEELDSESMGILKFGLRLVLDGAESGFIYYVLTNMIDLEKDSEAKRLGIIQREAVIYIQAGYNTRVFTLILFSHLHKHERRPLEYRLLDDDLDLDGLDDTEEEQEPEEPVEAMEQSEFLKQTAYIIRIAYKFSCKARREGLLSLEDELEDLDDEYIKEGLRLVVDGTACEIIDTILTNKAGLEQDENRRRLINIIKEAVLYIQRGDNPDFLAHKLLSFLDNSELKAVEEHIGEMEFFTENKFEEANPLEAEGKKFTALASNILHRAYKFMEKYKDLSASKEYIDRQKMAARDIFEYGMQFAANEEYPEDIELILSNLITFEKNEEIKRLKLMQKEAVLSICKKENPAVLVHALLSFVTDKELEEIQKLFESTKFADKFKDLLTSPICDKEEAEKTQNKYKEELEKSIGSREVIDFFNRPYELVKEDDMERLAEFIKEEHPNTSAFILAWLSSGRFTAGGIETIAAILKFADRSIARELFKKWKYDDPELMREIKSRMFSFEDIILLDDKDVLKVFREVDSFDLAKALNNADESVKEKVFNNMSTRAGAMLKEDMEYMGPVRHDDIMEARRKISSVAMYLEEKGEIEVPRSN